ncbi:hypothetical protein GCM10009765_73760 [Fodinicola feengrottensis]|uniref:Uncharacterized protein n=1 Tax=Fodinicola feengrottensis TaxID=435914 RepID=A0ABP4UXU9_9ACTN
MKRRPFLASVTLLALAFCSLPASSAFAAPAQPTAVRSQSNAGGGAVVVRKGKKVSLAPTAGPISTATKAKLTAAAPDSWTKSVYTYGPITLQPGDWGDGWVNCPSGMVATGGGESNTNVGGITVHNTYAMVNGSGWEVRITNRATAALSITFYAVCYGGLTSYHQEPAKALVGANTSASLSASCLSGDQIFSGGGWSDTTNTLIGTYKAGDIYMGWSFFVQNFDATAQSIGAQAVCGTGVTSRFVETDYTVIAPGTNGFARVACPPGTLVLGGGGGGTARITDAYPDGEGWRIYGQNDSQQNESVLSMAQCAS